MDEQRAKVNKGGRRRALAPARPPPAISVAAALHPGPSRRWLCLLAFRYSQIAACSYESGEARARSWVGASSSSIGSPSKATWAGAGRAQGRPAARTGTGRLIGPSTRSSCSGQHLRAQSLTKLLTIDQDYWHGLTMFEILRYMPQHNWSTYEEALKENPVLAKMMISGVVYSGDWIAQFGSSASGVRERRDRREPARQERAGLLGGGDSEGRI
ncbi:hypothetical protein SEVIR_5G368600v4 [Setaria viridis]|uniref:Uncharacterized protein n=1 Tax=Setaria viridis TaxID=4556 RepID=A0A4U6UQB9_SETVI|nr:uncharacterized protein LOC117858885 [Setaria viridis]TKW17465.1 hypothetical protein SEVIR_5G368600v2 [Setaria viridis]